MPAPSFKGKKAAAAASPPPSTTSSASASSRDSRSRSSSRESSSNGRSPSQSSRSSPAPSHKSHSSSKGARASPGSNATLATAVIDHTSQEASLSLGKPIRPGSVRGNATIAADKRAVVKRALGKVQSQLAADALNKAHGKGKMGNAALSDGDEPRMRPYNLAENSDSEDEAMKNRIGNVPLEWYKDEDHIGYDVYGNAIAKKDHGDSIDAFLARTDDPNYKCVDSPRSLRSHTNWVERVVCRSSLASHLTPSCSPLPLPLSSYAVGLFMTR